MASGVVAASSQRVTPRQRGQLTTSTTKTCRSSQAQGFLRGSGATMELSFSNSGSCLGVDSGARGTTSARALAWELRTPW